mgnify:FL=1
MSKILIFEIGEEAAEESGVYEIRNNINDMVYIGRTKNFKKRYEQHRRALENKTENYKLNNFLWEHPEVRFVFRAICITKQIKEAEEREIKRRKAVEKGFNILRKDDEFVKYRGYHRKRKTRETKRDVSKGSISSFLAELAREREKREPVVNVSLLIKELGARKRKSKH